MRLPRNTTHTNLVRTMACGKLFSKNNLGISVIVFTLFFMFSITKDFSFLPLEGAAAELMVPMVKGPPPERGVADAEDCCCWGRGEVLGEVARPRPQHMPSQLRA